MSAVVTIVPSGRRFVVERGEPLLEAALRSGLALEFGCTNGTCGECRARVCAGEVRRIRHHDYVIRDADKRRGVVLLCCSTADGDVTIEAGEASGPDDIPEQHVRARLYRQVRAGDGIDVVSLRLMRGKALRFLAGQHVRVGLAGVEPADLSIASCPCDGLNIELHLVADDHGELGARAAAGFGKSDRFRVDGPRGRFVLDEDSTRPLLFVACDAAIAPVKSIIEHAVNLELTQPIHLHWHATRASGHYLHNYFRSLRDALDDFTYVEHDGRVTGATLGGLPELAGADVYLAGGDDFVAPAIELLRERGAFTERIFVDALSRRPRPSPRAD
ncbi:MAG: 2Fe-2S iron-sulfur cluster-binding protein [Gammaproteobacteria bacterium]|nr:2Fe-2S iron-sulfur cluster-binding protein [Gammaproteobacteria bacterium]